MNPDTAAMLAATMTAATFGAILPGSSSSAREGWTPRELQRASLTAGGVALAGAAFLAGLSRSADPFYVAGALSLGLSLIYQLAAGARVR